VSGRAPRTLLMAAAKDTLVDPQRNTEGLAQRLRAAGVDVTVRVFGGVSHVTLVGAFARPLRRMAPVLEETLAFLRLPAAGPG
jgi:acetyl esterase/lipase